jgi:acetylornithine deacetylase/succinyl-diaminopimelate desuccinylase-like protein
MNKMSSLNEVYRQVDKNKDRSIKELQRIIRQPSISAQNIGVRECGELIVSMMKQRGIDARLMETDGQPVVFGEYDVGAEKTLLIYNHYDVQPPEPLEEWVSPPFEARIQGDKIICRGSTDSKGNLMSHLEAVAAYNETVGKPPINLKFIFDGEEESGSPSLSAFVDKNKDIFACDSVLSFDGGFTVKDRPTLSLGSSGLLYVKIEVEAGSKDLHSGRARLVPSAAWRMVNILASLKDKNDKVLIPGFYDKVKPPTPLQRKYLEESPWDDDEQKEALGIVGKPFLGNVSGTDALEKLLFTPTCNICSLVSGYLGSGTKTVLPHKASAKLDFRLVSDQTPDEIFKLLVEHLNRQGFEGVKLETMGNIEASRSDPDSDIARAIISGSETVYGMKPMVKPTGEASGKQANWFGNKLGLPAASTGIGPPDWFGHAPNEFMTIPHYLNGIKFAATIWKNFAG